MKLFSKYLTEWSINESDDPFDSIKNNTTLIDLFNHKNYPNKHEFEKSKLKNIISKEIKKQKLKLQNQDLSDVIDIIYFDIITTKINKNVNKENLSEYVKKLINKRVKNN